MAETSKTSTSTAAVDNTYSYNNGASITYMNSDQLFSILLLLSVDSILSFAMTCKRFRSLSCSSTLWEAICRRDWGSCSVDTLKSSMEAKHHYNQQNQLPWEKLYKQVYLIDSVSCVRLSEPGGELLFPGPRASHSLNFVSDCLVLFGGGCEGGRHLDDTWVAYVGNDFQKILKWHRSDSSSPSGRFGHTCVVIGDSLLLFGGINDRGIRQNDTWIGKIVHNENHSFITMSWKLLDAGPIKPPARGAHAACCIGNKMIIYGGIGHYALRLSDTWILDLSENISSGKWRTINTTHQSPPARSGHTLTSIGGTRTLLFGGRGAGYDALGDVWLLDISENVIKWTQVKYELRNCHGGSSLPRVGHSATLILGGQVLIYGGEDTYRNRKDDFWLLNINATQSLKMKPNKSFMWKMMKIKEGYAPKRRSFHRACIDRSGRYLYISGGMIDGVLQPAEAIGLRFDSDLFLVELQLQL